MLFRSVAVLAATTLVKFTMLPLMTCTVAAGWLLRRGRSASGALVDGVIFVAAMAAAWRLAGQPVSAVADYLSGSMEVARGYAQAMSWPGGASGSSRRALAIAACVVLASIGAGLMAITQRIDRNDGRLSHLGWYMFVVVLLLLGVRLGTTRGDPEHLVRTAILAGAFVLYFWPQDRRLGRWATAISLVCATLTLVLVQPLGYSHRLGGMLVRHFDSTIFSPQTLRNGLQPRPALDAQLEIGRAHV